MPISQTDQLIKLIKSLSKAEKRNFTYYSKRIHDAENLKYVQLFDIIDKHKIYDDSQILLRLKDSDKSQYSNLKRHLYKQLMISLRMVYIQKKADIEIREYLDYVDILYSKGLYIQSLKILEKAKKLATKSKNDILHLSLLETEKTIESRHITRSGTGNTEHITQQAFKVSTTVHNATMLSNLRLLVHAYYIQHGHIKNEEGYKDVTAFFEKTMPKIDIKSLNYIEQIYLYQSMVWYYYILLEFENCYIYSDKWVKIFQKMPEMLKHDPDLLMRGYHYLLTCCFILGEKEKYDLYLAELEDFRKTNYKKFSNNSQIVSFLYVHHGRLNQNFLHHTYDKGLLEITKTLRRINRYYTKLDPHRIMVLYYKISWMYLMAHNPDKAIDYLNEIQKLEVGALREDIQIYSRIMFLMAHFDLENYELMDYLVKNTRQFAKKLKHSNKVQQTTLKFFQKVVKLPLSDRKNAFKIFEKELNVLKYDYYEKRAFIYLDVFAWLSTKI